MHCSYKTRQKNQLLKYIVPLVKGPSYFSKFGNCENLDPGLFEKYGKSVRIEKNRGEYKSRLCTREKGSTWNFESIALVLVFYVNSKPSQVGKVKYSKFTKLCHYSSIKKIKTIIFC